MSDLPVGKEYGLAAVRFGATAKEWLNRWDAGVPVWSVEMGGLGPGYEQALQITAAEIVRDLVARQPDHTHWDDIEEWRKELRLIDANVTPKLDAAGADGISGAQWGAAVNLATNLYQRSPAVALSDEAVKDRLIQVSNRFKP